LFYRLDVSRLRLPPLRQRPFDIETLARHFVAHFSRELSGKALRIDDAAISALKSYDWPGNVRELKNAIERAAVLADPGTVLGVHDLSLDLVHVPPPPAPLPVPAAASGTSVFAEIQQVEKDTIVEALRVNKGNIAAAARMLNVPRTTLADQIQRL